MKSLSSLIAAMVMTVSAAQAELVPVDVEPIKFRSAALKVTGADGATQYSPQDLEQLGTFSVTTVTPWREVPAEFVGVRLSDVLAANGIEDAEAIRITAENDYAIEMKRDAWTEHQALIATRVDGKAHSRRARGPLQIVFPMTDDPVISEEGSHAYWVWMAASIEVLN